MHGDRGYTLIEVLVVTLIGLGIMAGFTSLYLSGQGTLLQSVIELQSQRDATLIVDEFTLRTRAAHSATISGGGTLIQFKDITGNNTYQLGVGGSAPVKFMVNGSPLAFSQIDSLSFRPGISVSGASREVKMGMVLSDRFGQRLRVVVSAVMRN